MFKRVFLRLCYSIKAKKNEFQFLIHNRHNRTRLHGLSFKHLSWRKVIVGKRTYGTINTFMFGNQEERLIIGNYCSIGPDCTFLLSGQHEMTHLMTFPFSVYRQKGELPPICKGPIIIEDDVWLGYGVTVLSGVTIGKGAVIGAKSVVSKNIPPYSIAVGNPIKIIRKRFSDSVILKLLSVDFSSCDEFVLSKFSEIEIDDSNIDDVLGGLKKNEKKL